MSKQDHSASQDLSPATDVKLEASDGWTRTPWPTATQRKTLSRAASHPLGISDWTGPKTYGFAAWERMHLRLVHAGLMRPYAHGGYEITDAGRATIAKATAQ